MPQKTGQRFRREKLSCFLFYNIKETLNKARLTALHAICLQIFRHIAQKSLAIHQVCLRNFCAICRKI